MGDHSGMPPGGQGANNYEGVDCVTVVDPTEEDACWHAQEGGGPAAQDMSGKMINDGGYGANSADEAREARYNKCVAEAVTDKTREDCKGLQ
jgi:hypothetical protein